MYDELHARGEVASARRANRPKHAVAWPAIRPMANADPAGSALTCVVGRMNLGGTTRGNYHAYQSRESTQSRG
ncbi:MAG TPA: hypothetical protein VNE18_08775, partial [Rhodanobacter sp.]|nr:hypothetical protein [Rhodanobacter sp.]